MRWVERVRAWYRRTFDDAPVTEAWPPAADAQVSGGAGADPATHGLAADPPEADVLGTPSAERMAQPPAVPRPPKHRKPGEQS